MYIMNALLLSYYLFLCYSVFTYSVPYVFMASVPLLLCLLHTQPLMSLCHSGFCSSVTLLLCLLHTLSLMSLCHSGFINVKYFYKLPILSVSSEFQVGQYPPFLSRTFRDKFVSINKTIVYKIKQRRQNSKNHKFIYERRTGKEIKERKNRCKK